MSAAANGVYVFVGPTLPVDEARRLLDAEYLPPVAIGDVYTLCKRQPKVIAIIDGLFEQTPAVWHKEILFALARGVRVLGASSMGALRAAELYPFGMEGVGAVFDAFVRGELEDDDEVAVLHGPASSGYRAISDAMVNLRLGLALAEERAIITRPTAEALVAAAKRTFYPDRSWPALHRAGLELGLPLAELDALAAFVRRDRPDRKRADAVLLLEHIARTASEPTPPGARFRFEPTTFWTHLTNSRERFGRADGDGDVTADRVRSHVRAVAADRRELLRGALLLHLVRAEAQRTGLVVKDLAAVAARFRRAHGLLTVKATNDWLRANGMTPADFTILLELDALVEALLQRDVHQVDECLPIELRRRDRFAAVLDAVRRKWQLLAERNATNPTLHDAGASGEELMRWYGERFGAVDADLGAHARELGLRSERDLLSELIGQFIYEKAFA